MAQTLHAIVVVMAVIKQQQSAAVQQLTRYLTTIANLSSGNDENENNDFDGEEMRETFYSLFSRLFCIPATSAPVDRIFSHSDIIMKPHGARRSDELLAMLMFVKCNDVADGQLSSLMLCSHATAFGS
jgi:hypothetical protein